MFKFLPYFMNNRRTRIDKCRINLYHIGPLGNHISCILCCHYSSRHDNQKVVVGVPGQITNYLQRILSAPPTTDATVTDLFQLFCFCMMQFWAVHRRPRSYKAFYGIFICKGNDQIQCLLIDIRRELNENTAPFVHCLTKCCEVF